MFRQKRDPASDKPTIEPADAVQQARTRARQRLIGAIVLLAIGVIGFPLVFETQPRPIPVDLPIEIPRRDALPPLAMPPPRSTAARPAASASESAAPTSAAAATQRPAARGNEGVMTESSAEAGREIPAPRATARASAPAETPRRAASAAVAAAPPAPGTRADDGERARALLEGRAASAAEEARYVVQVGAFADAEAARETRKNVEKLGLKTYTQVAQTSAGSRIRVRVGPFTSRGDAEAALAKAKAAGMNAVLLTL
ncbi:MAG TPA: SPOR domain-containing protein [Caldimonas sp.]|jgi:DedD protein|nr:SPOR domain-containing protein [Caldimonas sp.]